MVLDIRGGGFKKKRMWVNERLDGLSIRKENPVGRRLEEVGRGSEVVKRGRRNDGADGGGLYKGVFDSEETRPERHILSTYLIESYGRRLTRACRSPKPTEMWRPVCACRWRRFPLASFSSKWSLAFNPMEMSYKSVKKNASEFRCSNWKSTETQSTHRGAVPIFTSQAPPDEAASVVHGLSLAVAFDDLNTPID
jgi:hypothetical protein